MFGFNRLQRLSLQIFLALSLSLAALAPLTAQEDIPETGVSLGGRASYFRAQDADEGNWMGGAQLRFYLHPAIALEGSADYRRSKFAGTTVHTYPVQASLLLYLIPGYRLKPFLLGGGGWYFTTVTGPGNLDNTQNRFGAHAGGGLQFYLNRYWSIDASYRYIWIEKIQSRDSALVDKEFQDSGNMITAALNFHF